MFGPKAMKGFFGGGTGRGSATVRGGDGCSRRGLEVRDPRPAQGRAPRLRGYTEVGGEVPRVLLSSPGSVYPTLQLLEDMEYVSATQRDGKKVYAITEEGRKFLDENRRSVQDIWGKFGGSWDPGVASELHEIRHDLMDLGKLFGQQMREGRVDQEKLARIRSVISAATREIEDILREREDPGTTSV